MEVSPSICWARTRAAKSKQAAKTAAHRHRHSTAGRPDLRPRGETRGCHSSDGPPSGSLVAQRSAPEGPMGLRQGNDNREIHMQFLAEEVKMGIFKWNSK